MLDSIYELLHSTSDIVMIITPCHFIVYSFYS